MARLPPLAVASGALLLLLFVSVLPCRAAAGGGPSSVVLPVSKDDATQQYVTMFRQRTPQVPVKAVLDLAGTMLWVDCDAGYVSSSYAGVPCGAKSCRLLKNAGCAITCIDAPSAGCLNDTCSEFPKNTATSVSTAGNIITDVLSLPTTFRPAPGPLATVPAFLFTCGHTFLTEGLADGATGMVSLSRARFALPTQLADTFRFSRKFALCLPPASAAGVVVFGDAPYTFQPGVDLSKSLIYTPLLVNPVSTVPYGRKDKTTKYFIGETTIQLKGRVWREKPTDYFIGLTGIKVNGHTVPMNATLLAIDKKGVGGTKLSTVSPYTVLERSIHQAVTDAFAKEMAAIPRAPAVEPFQLCYDGRKVGSTRVGPSVPTIELVLESTAASWVVFGANSMVATKGGALCLGVVDAGTEPQTSVVIGGHMMEDNLLEFDLEASRLGFSSYLPSRQTTCNNFRLG
uniref:Peptidase A1 domain-containing protein n=1 Tax=Oryza punctata TaxID=4537 RepID=A0A0E0L2D0_ORYPU